MNWISFLTYLGAGYALYYLCLFLLDSKASPGKGDPKALPVLTFSETIIPEKLSLDDFAVSGTLSSGEPASVGSGGVSIKDLFELARKDAIEFTKSVSF